MADADGASEISHSERLEAALGGDLWSVSIGNRKAKAKVEDVDRRPHRVFVSWVFNVVVSSLLVSGLVDTQCGFKMFGRDAAFALFSGQHVERWAFDMELLFLCQHFYNIPVTEVPIQWREVPGSKLTIFGVLDMARDILMVRLLYLFGVWRPDSQAIERGNGNKSK
jgi:dolichyl-phosphate beta-glucosyltransferase